MLETDLSRMVLLEFSMVVASTLHLATHLSARLSLVNFFFSVLINAVFSYGGFQVNSGAFFIWFQWLNPVTYMFASTEYDPFGWWSERPTQVDSQGGEQRLLHVKKRPLEVLKNDLTRYAVVWIRILLFYIVSIFCMCCLVSQTDPRLLSPEHSVVEVRMKGTQSFVRDGHWHQC